MNRNTRARQKLKEKGFDVEERRAKAKETCRLDSLCRTYTEQVVRRWAVIALKSRDEHAALRASENLMDRGWGKAAQVLTVPDNEEFEFTMRIGKREVK